LRESGAELAVGLTARICSRGAARRSRGSAGCDKDICTVGSRGEETYSAVRLVGAREPDQGQLAEEVVARGRLSAHLERAGGCECRLDEGEERGGDEVGGEEDDGVLEGGGREGRC